MGDGAPVFPHPTEDVNAMQIHTSQRYRQVPTRLIFCRPLSLVGGEATWRTSAASAQTVLLLHQWPRVPFRRNEVCEILQSRVFCAVLFWCGVFSRHSPPVTPRVSHLHLRGYKWPRVPFHSPFKSVLDRPPSKQFGYLSLWD